MKDYRISSKIMLGICLCGIALAIVNNFTGIINDSVQISGTIICIAGFIGAGIAIIVMEKERLNKKASNV